jgi:hypothetical protein
MARMDAARANRIGAGLFFVRDWIDAKAGAPPAVGDRTGNLSHCSRKVKDILAAAELDPAITFTSFRRGGLTELSDSELSDRQIRAISRHKSSKVLSRYVKKIEKQIIDGTHKRRATRPAPTTADDRQLDLFGGAKGR